MEVCCLRGGCSSLKHKLKLSNLQTYKTMKLSASVHSVVPEANHKCSEYR